MTISLVGLSGRSYAFDVHPIPVGFWFCPIVGGGNYFFAKSDPSQSGVWLLYGGEAEDFKLRPLGPGHHKWGPARASGMNLVLSFAHTGGEQVRRFIESDLNARYRPPLNG